MAIGSASNTIRLSVAASLIAAGLFAITSCSRPNAEGFVKRSIIVDLSAGWHEEPGQSPRMYRRDGDNSGCLQVSLQPPLPRPVTTGEQAEKELAELLDSLEMDLGQRLTVAHETTPVGIMAFALYKSSEKGLVQFWLIPTEITVFATYTMGSLETVKQEIGEAHQIMKNVGWEK